jgi:hypothetical protein
VQIMKKPRLSFVLSAGLAGLPVAAQEAAPSVGILAEKLCTQRPPSLFAMRAEAEGLTPPLLFRWDLGDGTQWEGQEVPEHAFEFGRYNVILAVSDAAGHKKTASKSIDVEAAGCGGI